MNRSILDSLQAALADCMAVDRLALDKRIGGLRRRLAAGQPVDRALAEIEREVGRSTAQRAARSAARPAISYPEELPVSGKRAEIAAAIREHQVVVVAGETGSGKTTQLPKICLELGRGADGYIGHTQPRRIAARSVAGRIAQELNTTLGQAVGFKVRFSDRTSPTSLVKLMTDGILLAEAQHDRLLGQYDTLIIDEAHERSLNIDFLLGYLKRLLPRRPDLKLVITSATINTEAFSKFFGGAPVIEVSGRTFPVEVRYRALAGDDEEERDLDLPDAIVEAVDEAAAIDLLGDILVFLPGEREIRETAERLHRHKLRHTEVIPLFSRLSSSEQDRVFQAHTGRRIVLATNVAETSLTVPGIRFVIDSGLARISRYSTRTKVQRLPIEAIARASADQRAGRCGRVGPGVCIRLYSEEDHLARPQYTDPEILRTNLASVILQMLTLGLGDIDDFPFLASPDSRAVGDGFRLLHELGAVDDERRVTEIGRKLARLPVDPRLGRMLLAAGQEGCVTEVAIIASALSVQDPRERPMEAQQQADECHRKHHDERSDFAAFVNLWNWYHEQARHLSGSKLRKLCREKFLSFVRMREWHDIHGQLLATATELGLRQNEEPANYDSLHRALLSGLLGNIAMKDEPGEKRDPREPKRRRESVEFLGTRGVRIAVFPGSGLAKKPPKWIMAAELTETARLFARTVAAIDVAWVEALAGHLVKRNYFEPHWEKRAAQVAAFEQVSLYGLVIVPRRRVNFGPHDPKLARELFIRHALVEGEYETRAPFFTHNRQLIEEVGELEAKARRRDLLVDEQTLFDFYDARLPEGIYSGKAFEKWRRDVEAREPRTLFLTREALMKHGAEGVTGERFPDRIDYRGMRLALEYRFEPGHPGDGVTLVVPLPALPRLAPERFEWLVPGLLEERVVALIKSLPKGIRRSFVPAINFARAACEVMVASDESLLPLLTHQLLRMTGVAVPPDAWEPSAVPPHLNMNYRVVDERGNTVAEGRDLAQLQQGSAGAVRAQLSQPEQSQGFERSGLTRWDFGELPEVLEVREGGLTLRGYPALVDEKESVALKLFESPEAALLRARKGVRRLLMLEAVDKVKYLRRNLPGVDAMCLRFANVGPCDGLKEDLVDAICDRAFIAEGVLPRDRVAYDALLDQGRRDLLPVAERVCRAVGDALARFHEASRILRGALPPQRLTAAADMREQLSRLIYPGFVTATPDPWLARLPVYLEAVRRRLEKLERQLDRDRQYSREVAGLWQQWEAKAEAVKKAGRPLPPELTELRWLIEELRVSLYAQELGTAFSVSVPRLARRLAELR